MYTCPVRRVNSRFGKSLLLHTKNYSSCTIGQVQSCTTIVTYDLCYVIYVNHIADNNAHVINKKYLYFISISTSIVLFIAINI